MNVNIENALKTQGKMPADVWEQFEKIIQLPDEVFDKMYDTLIATLSDTLNSTEFQKEILANFKTIPNIDIDIAAEEKEIAKLIEQIKVDDSLSENKKKFLSILLSKAVVATLELYEVPRERITVEIQKLSDTAKLPEYAHPTDAGADVFSSEDVTIAAGETKIIKTGLKVAIPVGYEIQVRPRSGLSAKTGIRVANAPGTIDSAYRGEVGIILHNTADTPYEVKTGDKIAQLIISPVPMIRWKEVATISDDTERSTGGFGSSGR